jgi:hypothetical protein
MILALFGFREESKIPLPALVSSGESGSYRAADKHFGLTGAA